MAVSTTARRRGKKRKVAFRKNKKNISSALLILGVAIVFFFFMKVKSDDLMATKAQLQSEVNALEIKLEEEQTRAEKLKEFEVYTHTKKYAEEVAKDVLGYVYEDEIIFKPED